jgi:DNA-binding protein HU-beta
MAKDDPRFHKDDALALLIKSGGVTEKQAVNQWEALLLGMKIAIKSGRELVLPGIGKIVAKQRKARKARNPSDGTTVHVPEKTVLRLKGNKKFFATTLVEDLTKLPTKRPRKAKAE